jgi:hypothetical protein
MTARLSPLLLLLALPAGLAAQGAKRPPVPAPFAPVTAAVARELSGPRAFATVGFVEQFYRLPGNRGFNASIDTVAALLRQAGYVEEAMAKPADRLTYRIESRPMQAPAWSPLDGALTIVGRSKPLLTWAGNHNMLAANSWPTPPGGSRAALVDVGAGNDADFAKVDVKGKIVLGEGNARTLYTRAMQRGALGVVAPQKLPPFNQQSKNVNAIQFSGVARDTVNKGFLIYLSSAARDSIRAALTSGAVEVVAVVQTVFDVAPERTIVAEIRGAVRPTERFVYSAHVQEPGANDNATGVGLLAEMARTAAVLVKGGRANPARTMTFLWGDEIRATARYLSEDSTRRAGVKWGMSLDMVGENTALTGGTFLIEKMKDPSAVWVRGEDLHTEWGSSPVRQADIWPHFLNDFSRQRCLDRAATTGWVVKANPFEGGSDHTPFLSNKIPAVLFWHFTDQYYHTDRDRLEMVSPTTLANVGNCALTTGLLLTAGSPTIGVSALAELVGVATQELRTQAALSRAAIAKGGDAATERKILEAWRDYYVAALPTVQELVIGGSPMAAQVAAAQLRVRAVADEVLGTLK